LTGTRRAFSIPLSIPQRGTGFPPPPAASSTLHWTQSTQLIDPFSANRHRSEAP
jgi:hypothetical protein